MKEIFIAIKGYEGLYEVSNLGSVRSLDREVVFTNGTVRVFEGKVLKPTQDQSGYWKVHLNKEGDKKMFRLHQLLAIHFIDNIDSLEFVNFKDMDKNNISLENITWVSKKDSNQRGADKRKSMARKEVAI